MILTEPDLSEAEWDNEIKDLDGITGLTRQIVPSIL